MLPVFEKLKVSVSHNCSEVFDERKKAYTNQIVYGDLSRFQSDHLLHNSYKKLVKGNRQEVFVIVDEVDNMLLDNGNNMLYLSHSIPCMNLLDSLLIHIHKYVYEPHLFANETEAQQDNEDCTIKDKILSDLFGKFSMNDLKSISSDITDAEQNTLYNKIKEKEVIDSDGYLNINSKDKLNQLIKDAKPEAIKNNLVLIKNCISIILLRKRSIEIPSHLKNFAKNHLDQLIQNCKLSFRIDNDTDFVIDSDKTGRIVNSLEALVTLIDLSTGADLPTSQWSGGLHQFLQLKYGCRLFPINLKAFFISNVAYFKRYKKITGLSGTLGSFEESKTLKDLYGADLIRISSSKTKIFYEDVPIVTKKESVWIDKIYKSICDQIEKSRSVLLICENIKELEKIEDKLNKIFEEKYNECRQNIIVYKREHEGLTKEELQPKRLIIATNLAGRGTDIKLNEDIVKNGGLHVIISFMPQNQRTEEQAYGRAAR
jgi:golgin subfamily B member 1